MNGISYLLDTNVIIGILKKTPAAVNLIANKKLQMHQCAYSFITRMELLSFPEITTKETKSILGFLNDLTYFGCTPNIEEIAIETRKQRRLKLPDAIIFATAKIYGCELLSLDQDFTKMTP